MSRRDHEANGPLFTNEYTALPANAPPDRPHIIDTEYETECSERGNVNVWDAIATVIFKVSPAKLDMFLDPSNTEFKMDFDMKDYDNDFLIWKKADEVLVGLWCEVKEADTMRWDILIRCTISPEGNWSIESASTKNETRYQRYHYDGVWNEQFSNSTQAIFADTDQAKSIFSFEMGEEIMKHRWWDRKKSIIRFKVEETIQPINLEYVG